MANIEREKDKLQITIRGRGYTLRTDEDHLRLLQIADALDEKIEEFSMTMRGRTEEEILTFTAFDLMEQADSFAEEVERLNALLEETDVQNKQLLIELKNSAGSEMYQIASVKEQENNDLRVKIQEYEKALSAQLTTTIDSEETERVLKIKERENQKLSETLDNFERLFDDFAKAKEREIVKMQEEIEGLKLRLAEFGDDGQLTL